jgi:lactose/L-arabinose transport system ATP-binding protein
VAIGRAIVRGPDVFLFDEPLSNLDAELRVDMRVEIARLHSEIGATMIYVTHDQVEAMTLADKIVVLRAGRIEQVGSPMELYKNPDNKFVAGFIGSPSMNFLKGTVMGKNITIPGLDNTEISTTITLPKEGSNVFVGLRPQALTITKKKSSLKVHMRERLGGITFDYLQTNSGERIIVETKSDDPIDRDTQVAISFDQADVLLFDAKTELRLR